jgi:hypothetical protein
MRLLYGPNNPACASTPPKSVARRSPTTRAHTPAVPRPGPARTHLLYPAPAPRAPQQGQQRRGGLRLRARGLRRPRARSDPCRRGERVPARLRPRAARGPGNSGGGLGRKARGGAGRGAVRAVRAPPRGPARPQRRARGVSGGKRRQRERGVGGRGRVGHAGRGRGRRLGGRGRRRACVSRVHLRSQQLREYTRAGVSDATVR